MLERVPPFMTSKRIDYIYREEKAEEVDLLEVFFYHIYEFFYLVAAVAQVDVHVQPSPIVVSSPVIVSSYVNISS